ncbi:diguanylate cyclase [Vibrio metschnikovii]
MLTTLMCIQGIIESGRVSYYITSIVDITERKQLENKLRELSEKDSLTQLWNRRKFELELTHQVERIQAEGDAYPVCLVLLDIDFFKRVNDEQGHDQGDRVIIDVARLLTQHLRSYDFIARIGGEEFAVIMPSTRIEQAQQIIERLRGAVEAEPHLSVTVSAGITDLTLDATRSYKCADIALYESKKSGRNQVSTFLSQES